MAAVIDLAARRPLPTPEELRGIVLDIGSDVEIAGRVAADLQASHGTLVFCQGELWHYAAKRWARFTSDQLTLAVHRYDGARYETAKGDAANVKLGAQRTSSILKSMMPALAQPDFFNDTPVGINCANGFIVFGAKGQPDLRPHSPDHRCRHVLPGHWDPEREPRMEGSLLEKLLDGCFKGDTDADIKRELVGEVMGVSALGMGTRIRAPKAIVCYGETAENGKSQIIQLCREVLPCEAVSAIRLNNFDDDTRVCHLAGKLLNATDELALGQAVASETFKQVITGDPMDVRDVYKSAFELHPVAQHVFGTNNLPSFRGGMDRGVRRRLLLLKFNRVIPKDERVEDIASVIARDEPDLLLEMAVQGAQRVIASGGFQEPPSSKQALLEWIFSSDPILAWLDSDAVEFVNGEIPVKTYTREAYDKFSRWARDEGFKTIPANNGFTQRVIAAGKPITKGREGRGPYFVGLLCKGPGLNEPAWTSF